MWSKTRTAATQSRRQIGATFRPYRDCWSPCARDDAPDGSYEETEM